LINQRQFKAALEAAEDLHREAADRAQAYFLWHLTLCLSGRVDTAMTIVHFARASCPDFTPAMEGDMYRDQVIAYIRKGDDRSLASAAALLFPIENVHQDDPNRMACLQGVRGQLAYADRDYMLAERLHREADDAWRELGNEANNQWTYNNLVHWLKATAALHGGRSIKARQLEHRIRTECPQGAKSRLREAQLIRLPFIGNLLHDWQRSRH
jgi:hypothetical protein